METGVHESDLEEDDLDEDEQGSRVRAADAPPAEGLTVSEVAAALQISPTEVRRLIRAGHLPAQRHVGLLGAEYHVSQADMEVLRGKLPVDGGTDGEGNELQRAAHATDTMEGTLAEQRLQVLETEVAALRQEVSSLQASVAAGEGRFQAWAERLKVETHAELDRRAAAQQPKDVVPVPEPVAQQAHPGGWGRAVRSLLRAARSPDRDR